MFRHLNVPVWLISVCFLVQIAYAQDQLTAPKVVDVEHTQNGWQLTWTYDNPTKVTASKVYVKDEEGRVRQITSYGSTAGTSLTYTRPCTNYTVTVKLLTSGGWTPESEPYRFRTESIAIPPPPTNLSSTVTNVGRLLHWIPPNTTAHIRKYRIVGQSGEETVEQSATYDSTEAVLDAFHNWHNYTVVMYAENLCGSSDPSESIYVAEVTIPHQPRIVNVTDTETSITIFFERGQSNDVITHYRVNYTGANGTYQVNDVPVSASSVQLTEGIQSCFNHTITLYAVNRVGESDPAVVYWVVRSAETPGKPYGLSVHPKPDGSYVAEWQTSSNFSLTFNRLSYKSLKGVEGQIWLPGNISSAVLDFAQRCNQYTIQLTSENTCGYSEPSDPYMFDVVPLNAPAAPHNVTVFGSNGELALSWDASPESEHVAQYELDMVDDSGNFRSYWYPPGTQKVVIRDLPSNTTYYVAVTTQNACGWSPYAELRVQLHANEATLLQENDDGLR